MFLCKPSSPPAILHAVLNYDVQLLPSSLYDGLLLVQMLQLAALALTF